MRGIYAGASSVLASIDSPTEEKEIFFRLAKSVNPTIDLANQADEVKEICNDPTILLAVQNFCDELLESYLDRSGICDTSLP